MGDLGELENLHAITRARYEQRRQSFAKLVAEENRLRAELARVDDMDRAARGTDTDAIPMRAIGADVIWQGWTARTRTALNLQLARVLAVKEHHLQEVRRAYGKVLVVEELRTELRNSQRKEAAAKGLEKAIELSLR